MLHSEVIYARPYGFRPLALDLYAPRGVERPPIVVWIHGGGFGEGDRRSEPKTIRPRSFFTALNEVNIACASIDYRLTGEAIWPAQRDDVDTAIAFLTERGGEFGIDPSRLATAGDSAGGHLALMAAMTNPRVKAALAWYPLTDLRSLDAEVGGLPHSPWLGGVPSRMPDRMTDASPITFVTAASPPCMFVHGDGDEIYPPSQSTVMHAKLTEHGVESHCRIVPGADHGLRSCAPEAVSQLLDDSVAFLRGRLSR